jgi:hypothetical protein
VQTFSAVTVSVPVVRSMIEIGSSSDGNGTMTLKRKRSSLAWQRSGPSISSGFWVASTKNGASSKRWRATVTWCSCIASSSEDCVFGVARLIVGEHEVGEIGPGWKRKTRCHLLDEDVRAVMSPASGPA